MSWMDDLSGWLRGSLRHSVSESKDLEKLRRSFGEIQGGPESSRALVEWQAIIDVHLSFSTVGGQGVGLPWDEQLQRICRRQEFYVDLLQILTEQRKEDRTDAFGPIREPLRRVLDLVAAEESVPFSIAQNAGVLRDQLRDAGPRRESPPPASAQTAPRSPPVSSPAPAHPPIGGVTPPAPAPGAPAADSAGAPPAIDSFARLPRVDAGSSQQPAPASTREGASFVPATAAAIDDIMDREDLFEDRPSPPPPAPSPGSDPGAGPGARPASAGPRPEGDRPPTTGSVPRASTPIHTAPVQPPPISTTPGAEQPRILREPWCVLQPSTPEEASRVLALFLGPDPGASSDTERGRKWAALQQIRRAALRPEVPGGPDPVAGRVLGELLKAQLALVPRGGWPDPVPGFLLQRIGEDLEDLLLCLSHHRHEPFILLLQYLARLIEPILGRPGVASFRSILARLPRLVPSRGSEGWRVAAEVAHRRLEMEAEGAVLTREEVMALVIRDALRDGHVSAQENDFVRTLAGTLEIPASELSSMVKTELEVVKRGGSGTGELDARELFRRAVFVAASDGVFQEEERRLLVVLARILRLPGTVAQEIVNSGKGSMEERRRRAGASSVATDGLLPPLGQRLEEVAYIARVRSRVGRWLRSRPSERIDGSAGLPESDEDRTGLTVRAGIELQIPELEHPVVTLSFRDSARDLHARLVGGWLELLVDPGSGTTPPSIRVVNRVTGVTIAHHPAPAGTVAVVSSPTWTASGGRFDVITVDGAGQRAIRVLPQQHSVDPTGTIARAMDHMECGDADAARRTLDEAFRGAALPVGAAWRRGRMFEASRQFDEARRAHERALEAEPDAPEPLHALAAFHRSAGNEPAFREHLDRLLGTHPSHPGGLALEAESLHRNASCDLPAHARILAPARTLYPGDSGLQEAVSRALRTHGAPLEALLWLERTGLWEV